MYFVLAPWFQLIIWHLACSVLVEASPVPVRASLTPGSPNAPAVYEGGEQIPLTFSPPATSSSSLNSSPPLIFNLPTWVTAPYPNSLRDEDRNVFNTTLQGIMLAKKHSSMGNNNAGVYSVASFDSSFARSFPPSIASQNIGPKRLLVKVLKNVDDDMVAEVKALKSVGQFVASGMMKFPAYKSNEVRRMSKGGAIGNTLRRVTPDDIGDRVQDNKLELKPVIVMLKMEGLPLTSLPEYVLEKDPTIKRRMMTDTLKMMCDRVGRLALTHRFVHRDNIIGNVLVISNGTEVVDVNIIDWGGKYLSSIREDVTWEDLMGWCHRRWAVYVWEAEY
ncbi:hypothetical protein D9757_012505 [Collybiopsis confluens]|uniref:Protein kinase domain-containing protein n=1 Tax=Collybiopsis confluens TaxID=2823264 RepID=A0A8H5D2D7_9AGAR|nr:hypothetical protein D9757_012505 [Collybiopsis confluens]